MENQLVRYSRAGDVFHYRWAARRCLKMIPPNSPLKCVVIESSKERKAAGEYVIDVAEYLDPEDNGVEDVSYYQLKHSTKRVDSPFLLSGLKDTIEGFAARFSSINSASSTTPSPQSISFSIITNRPVKFKQDILDIAQGRTPPTQFLKTLKKYTKLTEKRLQDFCSSLKIFDGEGDYNTQRHELHYEISQLLSGAVDSSLVDSIIALVQDRALPDKNGQIVREDILKRFGVTSERDLFPASPEFDELEHPIEREQHNSLLKNIITASSPIIVHAAGGVGKTVVARHLSATLPQGSLGIVYDCFGSGKYRNRSQTRHRHRDALVQVINEIAYQGLCDPLIPLQVDLEDSILRTFLNRLQMAATALQKVNTEAKLIIFIDAADNAEMAAKEFNEPCFVHELLREKMPEGCSIVMLCRTERIDMLDPPHGVQQLELASFTQEETLIHFRKYFPNATHDDGREFWRLTAGNPRVQANALSLNYEKVGDVLVGLGPTVTTVAEQINNQLSSAIVKLKENFPKTVQKQIDAICLGLANLSPFIPIKVLATAAEVDTEAVKSFVADLGRPLWLSDDSVQFRDEPTETWFRENFSASRRQIEPYVSRLKPLAQKFPYVAEVLPSLLLQSGKYDELINLALSDDFLPDDSPIDQRNIRVFRLQFAFKAALKQKRYADAAKLALRAGEEVAGDNRQMELLKNNIDLVAPLQSQERVQELAFRRLMRGDWDGSENVYSASLLSSVEDFKGEARGYLRAAEKWLRLYFEERDRRKKEWRNERLQDEEIVELASAHFNLFGPERLVDFILSWQPQEVIFRVARLFIRRLIDAGNFEAIDVISQVGAQNQYLMVAIADELLSVGRFPPVEALAQCLDLLSHKRARIPKSESYSYEDTVTTAIVSFIEASVASGLSNTKILRVKRHYVSQQASHVVTSDFQDGGRNIFLRVVALDSVLSGDLDPDLKSLMPEKLLDKKKNYEQEKDIKEFKQVVGGLLPWYIVRSRLLAGDEDVGSAIKKAEQNSRSSLSQRWRDYDPIPFEISRVRFEILSFSKGVGESKVKTLFQEIVNKDNKIRLKDRLYAVRAAYRLEHLSGIRSQLEQSCSEMVETVSDEAPETKAGWFIDLARAVLPVSRTDAAAYFDCAIEAVSKFGDEIVERWEAIVSVAQRSTEGEKLVPEMAYRFIRCAELVGNTVAREKYFDRNGAVRVCARLCPASSFAALSRWRDRDVGWFDHQLFALAQESVITEIVHPATGWALSAFFVDSSIADFAALCIEKEIDTDKQQYILDTAVRDMRLQDVSESDWLRLEAVAQRFSLANHELGNVIAFYTNEPKENKESPTKPISQLNHEKKVSDIDWEDILGSLDLTTSVGISNAIERFKSTPSPWHSEIFWQEVFNRIPESHASKFLLAVVHVENAGRYDIQNALEQFPESWHGKISVKRIWNNVLSSMAQRFAQEFAFYGPQYFLKTIHVGDSTLRCIQEGIIEGLSGSCDLVNASSLFGFVRIVSPFITPLEATGLLDYALARFEEHIDDDYADGAWGDWLIPPVEMADAFAGFVWAALGSPRSSTRWQAAHCVRRLAEADCHREISALIEWMNRDYVGPFGSNRFPFYNLHARQYLLITMARVAIDHPEILRPHRQVFEQQALGVFSHILIQKFAAEVALSIEDAFPGVYSRDVVEKMQQVGISQLPSKGIDYQKQIETPWHAKGEVDHDLKFHFSYDFDRYWFNSLGDVFGVSAKQVEDLSREVLLKDWSFEIDDDFVRDPREYMWSSRRHERETWHSHSSYPRTDNYSFYLSYHAMLAVAVKLLHEMPVAQRQDWCEDEWSDWLRWHTLTRSDGRWLADRRDPAPLERRSWIGMEKPEHWRWAIIPDDFLDGLLMDRNGETWLNIFGSWSDNDGGNEESFHISSALVPAETSRSLSNALITCLDSRSYKLPVYHEVDMEFETSPFELKGWVRGNSPYKGLDRFDPHACQINYPPYSIGEQIIKQLGLSTDAERRKWYLPDSDKPSLVCEIWSSKQREEREGPYKHGKRINASLEFLTKLCSAMGREIIIEIQIERSLHRSHYTRSDDGIGYPPPYSKIYILSADGLLRDERTRYQLR